MPGKWAERYTSFQTIIQEIKTSYRSWRRLFYGILKTRGKNRIRCIDAKKLLCRLNLED